MHVLSRVVTVPSDLRRWMSFYDSFRDTGIQPEVFTCVPLTDPRIRRYGCMVRARQREGSLFVYFASSVKDALDGGYDAVMLYEDDARPVHSDVRYRFDALTRQLPGDFGMCYMGGYFRPLSKGRPVDAGEGLKEIQLGKKEVLNIWGTHALLIGRSAYRTVLDAAERPVSLVTDRFFTHDVAPKVRVFAAYPPLFVQDPVSNTLSDCSGALHGRFDFAELENASRTWFEKGGALKSAVSERRSNDASERRKTVTGLVQPRRRLS